MKTGALLCCVTLCLVLSSVTSIKDLKTIKDLKETRFGRQYPRHGLMLLHWFGNNIIINNNNIRCVNFNPAQGDYGFHFYGNYEFNQNRGALPECPDDSMYYAFGNLVSESSQHLPPYVTRDYYNVIQRPQQRNIERLVIRVQRDNPQRVEEVYITQHYEDNNQGSGYDPENTYRVSTSLLQQIQTLIDEHNNVRQLPNSFIGALSRLARYDRDRSGTRSRQSCSKRQNRTNRSPRSVDPNLQCETPREIKLEVKSTSNGYARISWSEIPESLVEDNKIGLYKDDQLLADYFLNGKTFGTKDTSTYLNSGLQVKLLTTNNEVIWTGPKFNDANGVLPTNLTGYNASLQLYTIDGYACARLFIKKSFTDWATVFYNSWVGFYRCPKYANDQYKKYENIVKFEKITNQNLSHVYDILEYKSGMAIGPGVQARFLIDEGYAKVAAHTKPWDGVISPVNALIKDELRK